MENKKNAPELQSVNLNTRAKYLGHSPNFDVFPQGVYFSERVSVVLENISKEFFSASLQKSEPQSSIGGHRG